MHSVYTHWYMMKENLILFINSCTFGYLESPLQLSVAFEVSVAMCEPISATFVPIKMSLEA